MREMGELSDVPIEPPEQTKLLNHCLAQAGVIAGGVPGAGGYDAIWLLVFDPEFPKAAKEEDETPLKRVERVWLGWTELSVSPLSAAESQERGVRVEQLGTVLGLEQAVRR
jgi:phosphomevalonate kinase